MRAHYDFSKMKRRENPYPKVLKQSVTIRLDRGTVAYFKGLAVKTDLPYQQLINLYLRDCAVHERELSMNWESRQEGPSATPPPRTRRRGSGHIAIRPATAHPQQTTDQS